jgi:hypothetical protein
VFLQSGDFDCKKIGRTRTKVRQSGCWQRRSEPAKTRTGSVAKRGSTTLRWIRPATTGLHGRASGAECLRECGSTDRRSRRCMQVDKKVELRFANHGAIPRGQTDSFLPRRLGPHAGLWAPQVPSPFSRPERSQQAIGWRPIVVDCLLYDEVVANFPRAWRNGRRSGLKQA